MKKPAAGCRVYACLLALLPVFNAGAKVHPAFCSDTYPQHYYSTTNSHGKLFASLSLSASISGHTSTIRWSSENEFNTVRYFVEQSIDNITYVTAADISANHHGGTKRYSVNKDISPLAQFGAIYYRVRAKYADGTSNYSKIAVVRFSSGLRKAEDEKQPE